MSTSLVAKNSRARRNACGQQTRGKTFTAAPAGVAANETLASNKRGTSNLNFNAALSAHTARCCAPAAHAENQAATLCFGANRQGLTSFPYLLSNTSFSSSQLLCASIASKVVLLCFLSVLPILLLFLPQLIQIVMLIGFARRLHLMSARSMFGRWLRNMSEERAYEAVLYWRHTGQDPVVAELITKSV
jgi:uncharacterized membrane protein YciS (DUF1049 family)